MKDSQWPVLVEITDVFLLMLQILDRNSGRRGPSSSNIGAKKLAHQHSVDLPLEAILEEEDEV